MTHKYESLNPHGPTSYVWRPGREKTFTSCWGLILKVIITALVILALVGPNFPAISAAITAAIR